MNKVVVSALSPKFKKLEKPLKKAVFLLFKAWRSLKNRQLEVYLVGHETLNKNVLAFPAPKNFIRPDLRGKKPLGEIYLNPDYIRKEKLELVIGNWKLGIPAKLAYMLIHGFLHLLGYDHKRSHDTIIMQRKEKRLLKKLIP